MSHLSDLLGAEAAPVEFDHGGKTYKVTPVTQAVKTQIERWLRKAAYADLYALHEDMPPAQYQQALQALQLDRASFGYNGPVFWATVGTDDGAAALVSILFQCGESEARKLIAERKDDVDAVVHETILSSLPRAQADAMRAKMRALRKTPAPGGDDANPPAPA
jgi:hypothetical protein